MLGSHNFLTSSAQSTEREVGIRTTDPHIIKGLIDRFDGAYIQDAQAINESITAGLVLFDDVEALAAESIGEGVDVIFRHLSEGEIDHDTSALDENEQETAIDAEVFLRRYKEGERDFTGINLTGVNLTSATLSEVSMIEANLSVTNLSNANLFSARLLQANMNSANLSGAILFGANLIAANLRGTNLIKADLRGTNLTASDLSKAKLTNAIFSNTNLSGANLIGVNLVGTNQQKCLLYWGRFDWSKTLWG